MKNIKLKIWKIINSGLHVLSGAVTTFLNLIEQRIIRKTVTIGICCFFTWVFYAKYTFVVMWIPNVMSSELFGTVRVNGPIRDSEWPESSTSSDARDITGTHQHSAPITGIPVIHSHWIKVDWEIKFHIFVRATTQ